MSVWLQVLTYFEWVLMALLFGLSVWSIGLVIDRRRVLAAETGEGDLRVVREKLQGGDVAGVKTWAEASGGAHAGALRTVFRLEGADRDRIDRAVKSYLTVERLRLERGLPWLATLGANAPFIGLFGTVLGIIRSFAALGAEPEAANSVMSGISQALYATAAGLFVAIPAVIAFNSFSGRIRRIHAECEALKDLTVSRGA